MKKIDLVQQKHNTKIGDTCENKNPNIDEDCLFYLDGEIVGFFIKEIKKYSPKLQAYVEIANKEFRSKNVPKSTMKRSSGLHNAENEVLQYSTILGSVPPKPHMRRPYPTISSVHRIKTAGTFIKAMLGTCIESEKIMAKIAPKLYANQKEIIEKNVPEKFRFGNLFTSSISNYNIAANYHIDKGNLKNCSNVIITKRKDALGGNLNVPDYDATINSVNNSMLVYPAWRNVHGVTPIKQLNKDGYRNSLIFYPLKSFSKFFD